MRICSCPASTALTTIPKYTCPADFGQMRRLVFQRLKQADGTRNCFDANATSPTDITKLAAWTPLLVATDGTKVVISPELYGLQDSGGDVITWGSGNEVPGGVPEPVGSNPITAAATFRHLPQDIIKAMRDLECDAAAGNLGIYPINEAGQFEAIKGDTAGVYYPIPIRSLFIGAKVHGGIQEPDSNAISWSYMPNWSDDVTIVTPEFDPLTQLDQ